MVAFIIATLTAILAVAGVCGVCCYLERNNKALKDG